MHKKKQGGAQKNEHVSPRVKFYVTDSGVAILASADVLFRIIFIQFAVEKVTQFFGYFYLFFGDSLCSH